MVNKKKTWKNYLGEGLMLCLCAVFFVPFYYLLVNTFKPARDATVSPLSLPIKNFTLDLYKEALSTINFWSSLRNSLLITAVSVVIIIVIGSMAAYAITRRKNKLTKFLFFYFLIGFMVPVQTTLIPLFNLMSSFRLQNSVLGMIVLYSSWCNFALFMYQGFLGGVPKDLEEAALIDGAGLWKMYWKIVFPLLKPVTTTIAIFDVMWIWNDFMMPYLFISSSEKFTLIMEVYKGVGQFSNNWTVMLCTMVIVLIPITVFYILMQKHIIAGITSGAVKG
ncbi:MAG: carbohydrate ABC transporter permease [Clostridia bacterium]|nr:carbohydrate ABC transporter permease [Clostridia bacterium]NCC44476.1 carbohydrate ABC transporter permease [Clostridia bacterium]